MRLNNTSTPSRTRRRSFVVGGLAVAALCAVSLTAPATAQEPQAQPELTDFVLASSQTSTEFTAPTGTPEVDEAQDALADAAAALTEADSLADEIADSELELGDDTSIDTSVDTAELQSAVASLEQAEGIPAAMLPGFTAEVTALVPELEERTSALRGEFDAAKQKAEEEAAAEEARQEAEAAAAAEAEAEAEARAAEQSAPQPSTPSSGGDAPMLASAGGGGGDNSPAGAQATARGMLGNYGWGDGEFSCLVSLWNKESGWNYQAYNAGSGAFGIPQALPGSKMASAGADWQSSAATQIAWGLGYISGRYGSPCGAWGHSQSVGWY